MVTGFLDFRSGKKGVAFYLVTFVSVVLLFAFVFIFFISPLNSLSFKYSPGERMVLLDYLNKERSYLEQVLPTTFRVSKGMAYTQFKDDISKPQISEMKINSQVLEGCVLVGSSDIPLWFNQVNLDTMVVDSGKSTQDGASAIEKKLEVNCLPNLEYGEEFLLSIFATKVEQNLNGVLAPLGSGSYRVDSVEVLKDAKDKTNSKVVAKAKVSFLTPSWKYVNKYSKSESLVSTDLVNENFFSYEFEVGNFQGLLDTFKKVIPTLSEDFKKTVPSLALENGGIGVKAAILKRAVLVLEEANPQVLSQYEVRVSEISQVNEVYTGGEYVGLKYEVFVKSSGEKILEFGVIVKYSVPLDMVSFDVSSYGGLPGSVSLVVSKPSDVSKVNNYVVLYGYENFFDESSSGFVKLSELLAKGEVPTGLRKQEGNEDIFGKYYYSAEDSGVRINSLSVQPRFVDKENSLRVLLYQIYDFDLKTYVRLEGGRDLYVFVFAVDKDYKFDVNSLKKNFVKSAKVSSSDVPLPVLAKTSESGVNANFVVNPVSNIGDKSLGGLGVNAFSFEISGYEDFRFFAYDLYIVPEDRKKPIVRGCVGAEYSCFYFGGLSSGVKQGKFLVLETQEVYDSLISQGFDLSEFSSVLLLSNFKDSTGNPSTLKMSDVVGQRLYVIPVSGSGEGLLSGISLGESVSLVSDYFVYVKGNSESIPATSEILDFEFKDVPKVTLTLGNFEMKEGGLVLPYTAEGGAVTSIKYFANLYDVSLNPIALDSRGYILDSSQGYSFVIKGSLDNIGKVEVKKVVAYNGNMQVGVLDNLNLVWVRS